MRLCNERQEKILAEVRDQNEILINQNGNLNDKLDNVQGDLAVVQDKLEISVEDRCPKVRTSLYYSKRTNVAIVSLTMSSADNMFMCQVD
jgi:hypothetical protein